MITYSIPKTDLVVSRLAYGTWHLGGSWDTSPLTDELKQRAHRLISVAVEQGINHIDLADIYTRGKSDEAVGHVLGLNPSLRDSLIIQSKCGIILKDDPNPGDPGRYDFSYEHIVSSVEGSLRRLKTDRLDILTFHRPDPLAEFDELARAVEHLHKSGKVRYFGVSNHNWSQIALLQKHLGKRLIVNQVELSLLHHYLITEGIFANIKEVPHTAVSGTLDYCRLHDIMIQAWSPVAGGRMLSPKDDAPNNEKALAMEIQKLADAHKTSREAIAVAWLLRHPAGIQPVIGTLDAERLVKTALADKATISRIEWYRLMSVALGSVVP